VLGTSCEFCSHKSKHQIDIIGSPAQMMFLKSIWKLWGAQSLPTTRAFHKNWTSIPLETLTKKSERGRTPPRLVRENYKREEKTQTDARCCARGFWGKNFLPSFAAVPLRHSYLTLRSSPVPAQHLKEKGDSLDLEGKCVLTTLSRKRRHSTIPGARIPPL